MKKFMILLTCILLFTACSEPTTRDEAVQEAALNFADAYFNFNFKQAQEYATEESGKWLRYVASNVTQADIDSINNHEETATVTVGWVDWQSDSTAVVCVKVSNFAQHDSIGRTVHFYDNGQFLLTVVKRDSKSYVRMEGPLRNERQSRD